MEVKPLSSLNSLLSWNSSGSLSTLLKKIPSICDHTTPIPLGFPNTSIKSQLEKTLVCHDFQGGYGDDRFCFGNDNSSAYKFYHWSSIDIFVYFSHQFVTIPPVGWTAAAHKNGVKILGTLITEWDHGSEIWKRIFEDESIMELAINNLVEICEIYRFDGWLLNIENKIDADKVEKLIYFVKELTNRMRFGNANSLVIWYDSVTVNGELKWQNMLNSENRSFFDVCDGIFLNYTWTLDGLKRSVREAGDRVSDVFVGVDVFGRGCYKGGGFNCPKAMSVIREHELSAAIFAPGWTYEVLGSENFLSSENKFWGLMRSFLLYHGPQALPLQTSFCQGFGKNLYENGRVIEKGPWFNLSKQEIQPLWQEFYEHCCINVDSAFSGGSSLVLWLTDKFDIRLMILGIDLIPWLEIEIAYSVRGSFDRLHFYVSIAEEATDDSNYSRIVYLKAERKENVEQTSSNQSDSSLNSGQNDGLPLESREEDKIFPKSSSNVNGWRVKKYFLFERRGKITGLGLIGEGTGVLSFGQITMRDMAKQTKE